MSGDWSGRKVQTARARLAATLPAPCYRCGRMITGDKHRDGDTWDVDHIVSQAEDGAHHISNYAVSHSYCNRKHGQKLGTERKKQKKIVREIETERTTKFWNLKHFVNKIQFFLYTTKALVASPPFFVSEVSK